ncbi:hypothetical protein GCM10009753_79040 [Streptantibioticus ferralitis]
MELRPGNAGANTADDQTASGPAGLASLTGADERLAVMAMHPPAPRGHNPTREGCGNAGRLTSDPVFRPSSRGTAWPQKSDASVPVGAHLLAATGTEPLRPVSSH